jgi:hypothetical protein
MDGSAAVSNLFSSGSSDIFISVYDTLGTFSFAKGMGGNNSDAVECIAANALNDIFITGSFTGIADFDPNGTFNISAANTSDVNLFCAGYTAAGVRIFAKSIGGTEGDGAYGIACVNNASVLVTGIYEGSVDFDPSSAVQTRTGPFRNAFFAKYTTAAGAYVFAKEMGKRPNVLAPDIGRDVTTDAAGNIYVCGDFTDTTDFDIGPGVVNLTQSGPTWYVFVAKYSPSGALLFAQKIGNTTGTISAGRIFINSAGHILVTGTFSGTIDFDPAASVSNLVSNSGSRDVYLATYTANGAFVGAAALMATASADDLRDCYLHENGYLYVAGGTGGILFGKYSGTGSPVWTKQLTNLTSSLTGAGIRADSAGNVFLTGNFSSSCDFDPSAATYTLNATSSLSFFLAKYDNSGNFVFAHTSQGNWWQESRSMEIDSAGRIYIMGRVLGNADVNFGSDTTTVSSVNTSTPYLFLASYDDTAGLRFAFSVGGSAQRLGDHCNRHLCQLSGFRSDGCNGNIGRRLLSQCVYRTLRYGWQFSQR